MAALTQVTISGIDDETNPNDLKQLYRRFPFVEFGVLYSYKNRRPRYPSLDYIVKLEPLWLPLSLHFCGEACRDIMSASIWPIRQFDPFVFHMFRRFQLNGWYESFSKWNPDQIEARMDSVREIYTNNMGGLTGWNSTYVDRREVIFQCANDGEIAAYNKHARGPNTALFVDPSGGRGVDSANKFEHHMPLKYDTVRIGYAGGIGPDNIDDVLKTLESHLFHPYTYWIDMESRIRTDDRLDLNKVETVLKIAEPFVNISWMERHKMRRDLEPIEIVI